MWIFIQYKLNNKFGIIEIDIDRNQSNNYFDLIIIYFYEFHWNQSINSFGFKEYHSRNYFLYKFNKT